MKSWPRAKLNSTNQVNKKKVNSQKLKLPSGKILKGEPRKEFELKRLFGGKIHFTLRILFWDLEILRKFKILDHFWPQIVGNVLEPTPYSSKRIFAKDFPVFRKIHFRIFFLA